MSKEIQFSKIEYPIKNPILSFTSNIRKNRLTALMGPSGCGKTTLLRIISGRFRQPYTGVVRYDDNIVDQNLMIANSAYIYQDDIHLPYLTIRESLNFVSRLRNKEINFDLIKSLGLDKIIDSRIGNSSFGISAGERKRLSIALALIDDPDIIFMDEPTSGLDALTAINLIRLLKKLKEESLICCAIHQPSADVFFMFDDLILMSCGIILYEGPIKGVFEWFTDLGLVCPNYSNPADFIFTTVIPMIEKMDVKEIYRPSSNCRFVNSNNDHDQNESKYIRSSHEVSVHNVIHDKLKLEIETTTAMPHLQDGCQNTINNISQNISNLNLDTEKIDNREEICKKTQDIDKIHEISKIKSMKKRQFMKEFIILSKRHTKSIMRDKLIGVARIFQALFTTFMIAVLYYDIYNLEPVSKIKNISGVLYFFSLNMLYASSMSCIPSLYTTRNILQREYQSRYYSYRTFFISKILFDTLFNILFPLVQVPLICIAMKYDNSISCFLITLACCIVTNAIGHSMAVFVSALCPTVLIASAVLPSILLPLTMLSGLLVDPNSTVIFLRVFQYLSPTRYAFNIFRRNEFRGVELSEQEHHIVYGFLSIEISFLAMFLLYITNIIMAYSMLKYRIKNTIR